MNFTFCDNKIVKFFVHEVVMNDYKIIQDNCGCIKDEPIAKDGFNALFRYIISFIKPILPQVESVDLNTIMQAFGLHYKNHFLIYDNLIHLGIMDHYIVISAFFGKDISKPVKPPSIVHDDGTIEEFEPFYQVPEPAACVAPPKDSDLTGEQLEVLEYLKSVDLTAGPIDLSQFLKSYQP